MQYVRGDGVVVSSTLNSILCSNFTGMGRAHESIVACLSGKQPPARLNVSKALGGGVTASGCDSRGMSLCAALGFSLQDPTMDFHVSHDPAKFELQIGEGVQYQFRHDVDIGTVNLDILDESQSKSISPASDALEFDVSQTSTDLIDSAPQGKGKAKAV